MEAINSLIDMIDAFRREYTEEELRSLDLFYKACQLTASYQRLKASMVKAEPSIIQ